MNINQKTYLSNLTPLRGIAAILTVIFHVDLMLGNGGDSLIKIKDSLLLSKMYLMVDFFFILSGFIMCHVYQKQFVNGVNGASYKKFLIARFARIYPLYFTTLIFTCLLFFISSSMGIPKSEIIETENSVFSFFTNLFLVQSLNLHKWFTWVHASWSISTEWWAYMLFPFLVIPIAKAKTFGRIALVSICFAGYLLIAFYLVNMVTLPESLSFLKNDSAVFANLNINVAFQYGLIRCLCGFVIGMVIYQLYLDNWLKSIFDNGFAIITLTIGLFLCMHFALADFITVLFFPFILLAGAYGSKSVDSFFSKSLFQKLGDWSFSIYLVHQPLLYLIGSIQAYLNPIDPAKPPTGPAPKPELLTAWLICLAFIGLTLLVSSVTYKFIEVPARNKINKKWGKGANSI